MVLQTKRLSTLARSMIWIAPRADGDHPPCEVGEFRLPPLGILASMDEQQQPTIRITLDDSVAQGEYINFANIIHSPSEFVIDLGRIVPGRTDVKIYSRVIMTPLHAKQLMEALAQNIAIFEQKFGEIRLDGATAFSSNEPSN